MSASCTPGTLRIDSASRSSTAWSRPSLTLGTHSRTGRLTPTILSDSRRAHQATGPATLRAWRNVALDFSNFYTLVSMPLPLGKLRAELLEQLFRKYVPHDPRVVVGPRVGEDAAVLDIGDRYLVATTDPITFATDELGRYALHVNANDLAVRGARPLWFLATVLLPEDGTSETRVESLFVELTDACAELGVALIGGHTEVTAGLPRPLVVGTMLGEVEKDRLVTTSGAREGDTLLLTKGVPLEGAAILARERGPDAIRRGVPVEVV